nr:polysaccharide deacetylase family protein [Paenibacillus sp. NEAU-GSW1]
MKALAALLILAIAVVWPVSTAGHLTASSYYYKNKVIVLMYHHIDSKESGATISPGRFGTHMKLLKERGYNVISVEQFADFMLNKGTVPENAVVITFDDGYESFNQYAVPIMKKYNFVGTHFIIGASSDKNNVATKHLTWETMRKLKQEGHSFYSHTYDLHNYGPLNKSGSKTGPLLSNRIYLKDKNRLETQEEYEKRVTDDAIKMEARLKDELDNEYQMIAFPFGAFNSTAKQIEKDQGVSLFFTTRPGINKAGSDEVFRLNAGAPKVTANKFVEMLEKYH